MATTSPATVTLPFDKNKLIAALTTLNETLSKNVSLFDNEQNTAPSASGKDPVLTMDHYKEAMASNNQMISFLQNFKSMSVNKENAGSNAAPGSSGFDKVQYDESSRPEEDPVEQIPIDAVESNADVAAAETASVEYDADDVAGQPPASTSAKAETVSQTA
jgi:hypothetical protein